MTHGWTFDEHEHAGAEHLDPAEAARFDEKSPFDPTPEVEVLCDAGLAADDVVVDFGTGTGVFPLAVAEHCERVVAVDVAESMVDVVREKVDEEGVGNVEVVHDGFLRYEHEGDPAAFAFSKDALHHLPDFWKVEALKTVGETLEPGGVFRLCDFVFSFAPEDSIHSIDDWITDQKPTPYTDEEIFTHFRDEFSTYGFLLEPMLEEAGFDILDATYEDECYASYTCRWHGDVP